MRRNLLVAAFAALALVGCQKQSELNFDDISTKATVQGYVYIDQGYVADGSGFAKLSKPADGVAVAVKVDYTAYDKDAAGGQKLFEATCDANGFYQVEIPVGQKAISGMSVYTRPFIGKYYDIVNYAIMEMEVSYPEASTSVEIEQGKVFTAQNITITKDVEKPILTRNQIVTISGKVVEQYEKKEYKDPSNPDLGYTAVTGTRDATKPVSLVVTVYDPYSSSDDRELIFNITADKDGAYSFEANLYDSWDISDLMVEVEAKSYLNTVDHYYYKYDSDEKNYVRKSQEVNGYFKSNYVDKNMSDGDLLIGCVLSDLPMKFVPDYAKQDIYGIGNPNIDTYDAKGNLLYKSENPLNWAY